MKNFDYKLEDNIGVLTITRSKALNALNSELLEELGNFIESELSPRPPRALIITGEGEKAFVAGADIKEIDGLNGAQATQFAELGHRVFNSLESLKCPVLAAVNGFALGGGLELALSCDIIYASENAKFGLPEVTLGIIPGFGGTQRLARQVGRGRAQEMIFTGKFYSADDAKAMGLVAEVFTAAELISGVQGLAQMIAERGPLAVAKAKEAVHAGLETTQAKGLELEKQLFASLFGSNDQKEGTKAFIEKRKPQFSGQ